MKKDEQNGSTGRTICTRSLTVASASADKETSLVVGCSRQVPAGNNDAREDISSPHANSESKGLPVGDTSLEKGPNFPVKLTRDTENMVLDSSPMVETGDGNVIGSPSENPEMQKLRVSKTSLETEIDLPLKRNRDTAEIVMDACANANDRIMSSDGVIPSPSGCINNNQLQSCGTCQKRKKSRKRVQHLQGSEETAKASNGRNTKKKKKASATILQASRVPEISQSFANRPKSASLEFSLTREEALVTIENDRTSHAGSDVDNILDQQIPDELVLPMPHPASVVKTRGSAESNQGDQVACPMPYSGANIEGQNIITSAEPHIAGPGAVEIGDSAASDQEIKDPQDACSLPSPLVGTQANVAPLVHEGVLGPSAGVTAPVPSLTNNATATGQSAIQPVPQIPFTVPVFSDPFQHELKKLQRESVITKMTYEEKKSVLTAELERRLAELQAEYERKFHEAEAEHRAKMTKIKTIKNLVTMNHLLGSAFSSKCKSRISCHSSAAPRGRIQQLAQVSALRNYTASAPAPLQAHASSFPSSVSRPSGLPLNPTQCPMPHPRQPFISNTAPYLSAVNARLVSLAPHINPYRSSSSSIPIPTTTPSSSAVPQALTYSTARTSTATEPGEWLQRSNDVVFLSDK